MDCRDVREQLGAYLDGELPADSRSAVEAHLALCSACAHDMRWMESAAAALAPDDAVAVPEALWPAIEAQLDRSHIAASAPRRAPGVLRLFGKPVTAAASIVFVVGLGVAGVAWLSGTASRAEARAIDFQVLLDALPLDAENAFQQFLVQYNGTEASAQAVLQYARDLNFAIPDVLPGGFRLKQAYTLRFGGNAGAAAAYYRDGEFVATIFHPPVRREHFGSHRDLPCVVGQHRGHKVVVGEWRLVHLTDPTTCHCVLSRLDESTELPAIMAAVASRSGAYGHGG